MKNVVAILMSLCMIFILAACGSDKDLKQVTDDTTAKTETAQTASTTETTEGVYGKKVASISIFLTGDLMALGIKPDGTTTSDYLPITEARYQNIEYLGFTKDPDMEALIGLQPDEIFIDAEFAEKLGLEKLEKIATTHVINLDEGSWKDQLRNISKVVDREETAEEFIASYDAKAKEVSTLAKQAIGDGTVMAVRISAKGLRVYGMERPLGPILFEDLALTPAKGVESITKNWENISKEVLPDFDADAIFVLVSSVDEGSEEVFEQLKSDPIWMGLKAVQNDQVYVITEQPWLDYSASGNMLALEDLERILSQ